MKRIAAALLFLPIVIAPAARGWTRVSDARIARKAAELAPNDLRQLIDKFAPEYKQGLELAQNDEGSASHRYFVLSRSGLLRERIEKETAAAIASVRKRDPMSMFVQRLGTIAHLVADANDPFHVANDNPRLSAAHDDFEQYFERRMAKFPTVFYGLDPQFRMSSFLDRTFVRTARFYPVMGEEYLRGGELTTSASFDDRSSAFGVASVCYSHAVTDLVNLYYYIWKEAGGDVRSARLMRGGNLLVNP